MNGLLGIGQRQQQMRQIVQLLSQITQHFDPQLIKEVIAMLHNQHNQGAVQVASNISNIQHRPDLLVQYINSILPKLQAAAH